jgi:hypothetical protein
MFREADEILEQAIRTLSQENNQASGRGAQYHGIVPSIEREDRGAYIPLPLQPHYQQPLSRDDPSRNL